MKPITIAILFFFIGGLFTNDAASADKRNVQMSSDLTGIISIDHSSGMSTALQNNGAIWTWKGNEPAAKGAVLPNAVQITTRNIGLKKDGTVWTWDSGAGNRYFKAKGITAKINEPIQIEELKGIKKIESGSIGHLALDERGEVWYWGEDGCMAWLLREDVKPEACYHLSNDPSDATRFTAPLFTSIPAKVVSDIADMDIETGVMLATKKGHIYHIGVWDNVHMGEVDLMMNNIMKVAAVSEGRYVAIGLDKNGYILGTYQTKLSKQKGFVDISAVFNNSIPYLAVHQDGTVWSGHIEKPAPMMQLEGLKGITRVKARSTNSGIALAKQGVVYQWGTGETRYDDHALLPFKAAIKPVKVQRRFTVILNGKAMKLAAGPVILNGTTLVPMRDLFEALGAKVDYENGNITVSSGDLIIKLEVYRHEAEQNGIKKKLTEAVTYYNGKTYIPLRFIAEAFGAKVSWDASSGTAVVEMQ
ncbi:stalk domain-containing protein [Candidatus Pristimantibacillus sp. PTI5]|uniref:stalk domain-containing protein n=1 Tax=Candidatus Pristimantibacillus sp. PTI5 TaxID=3400422 RepID=UPI003B027D69